MRAHVLQIPIDLLERHELQALFCDYLLSNTPHSVLTPNPEMILSAKKDAHFSQALCATDLLLPDAIGISYGLIAKGECEHVQRHPGVDVFFLLCELAQKKGSRILILGGEADRAERAAQKLREKYPGLLVEGLNPGRLSLCNGHLELKIELIERIQALRPQIIALALPHEKQAAFFEHLSIFPGLQIAIGIGGAADMISGDLPRAPQLMRSLGLEWLWRLFLEPQRFLRIWRAVIVYPAVIAYDSFKRGQFFSATSRVLPAVFRNFFQKNL